MTNQKDPFSLFHEWYEEAQNHKDVGEFSATNLATATKDGVPSNRMVLLKGYDERGFIFYTNLESKKKNISKAISSPMKNNMSNTFVFPHEVRNTKATTAKISCTINRPKAIFP